MPTRPSVVVSLVAAAVAAVLAQAPTTIRDLEQAGSEPPANTVRLEVYPSDDGQAVSDLQQADLDVFEDNVPQALTSFERIGGSPRLLVFFVDTYHLPLDVAASVRTPLAKFIDRLAGPDDMVALMTPEMSPTDVAVGRKSAVISDIMQDVTTWARRGRSVSGNDGKDDLYEDCYSNARRSVADEMIERRHEMLSLDALDSLIVHLRRVRPERKAVIAVTDGWRVFTQNPSLLRDSDRNRRPIFGGIGGGRGGGRGFGGGQRGGSRGGDEARGVSSSQMVECESDRGSLAMLDDSLRMRRIEDDANRATVALYPVLASGVAPPQDQGDDRKRSDRAEVRQPSLGDRAATLRELADNTDGVAATDEKTLDAALSRIASDLGSYYLLSYTSSNTKLDGRFRAIAVRVKRPGVRVRTRRGYRGMSAEELAGLAGEETRAVSSAVTAVAKSNAPSGFRVKTATWFPPSSGGATMWIVGELDYHARKELAWSAGASGDVVVLAADGHEVASQPVDVRPADGRFTIRIGEQGAVAPGEYAVRVRLHPDAEPATTVTETSRLQVKAPSTLGEPVMWRRGPSTGPQYMMTADPRFERTERIRVELPTTSMETATARLLDRSGKDLPLPVQVSTRQEPGADFRWVVADLSLAPLGVGDYAIEVTLGGTRQVAAFALVP